MVGKALYLLLALAVASADPLREEFSAFCKRFNKNYNTEVIFRGSLRKRNNTIQSACVQVSSNHVSNVLIEETQINHSSDANIDKTWEFIHIPQESFLFICKEYETRLERYRTNRLALNKHDRDGKNTWNVGVNEMSACLQHGHVSIISPEI